MITIINSSYNIVISTILTLVLLICQKVLVVARGILDCTSLGLMYNVFSSSLCCYMVKSWKGQLLRVCWIA